MQFFKPLFSLTVWAAACALAAPAAAYELYQEGNDLLNADVTAVFGVMHSHYNYDGRPGGTSWREGFVKYGLSGQTDKLGSGSAGTVYGGLSFVSSGTWGNGDAGGMTNGSERRTSIEDAFLGWRSADLFPALGKDGLDVSAGRQVVKVGRGFLINDDGLNAGNALGGGGLSRGGAYYIAARHSFANTAVLRLGGQEGLHGSAMWLKSDNRAQARTEMGVGTLEYTAAPGTLGLTYIHGIDVDARYADPARSLRKGMDMYSLRGEGNAGIDNADFAFEFARQRKDTGTDTAWYAQAGYEFADLPWKPKLTYRYVRYGKNWDSFFTGGYMGWLQGEVAGNYAGPFNTNTRSHHVALTVKPTETLTLGALFFDFRTLHDRAALNLDGRELDLYAEWAVNEHLIISPLVGLYKPAAWAANGGLQSGKGRNVYAQVLFIMPF